MMERRGQEEHKRTHTYFQKTFLFPSIGADSWDFRLLGYGHAQRFFITPRGQDALPEPGLDSEPNANGSTK